VLNEALSNWTMGGKMFLRSGCPFSIVDSELAGHVSPNIDAIMLSSYQTSNPITRYCNASVDNTPCFSFSDFVPSLGETGYGNVARNSFYGPGYFDIDATLFKNFPIWERMRLSAGAQAFNLMNHPHFANPNFDIAGSGGFGTITSTVSPANQSLRLLRRFVRGGQGVGPDRPVDVLMIGDNAMTATAWVHVPGNA
jgi:hypothetical protein